MVVLTLFITTLLLVSTPQAGPQASFQLILFAMALTLWLRFRASGFFTFYFLFEASLAPIFLLVLGWGYQPERLNARLSLLLYTVVASLPLLLRVVLLNLAICSSKFYTLLFIAGGLNSHTIIRGLIRGSLLMGFMVKIPLFLTHL